MERTIYWSDLAELTHATQIEQFNFCMCEDNEGQENPYNDCPKSMNTCYECSEDYPSNETEWTDKGYRCEWCKNDFTPLCGDHLISIKDCGCRV